jgi:hypothetical protein
MKTQTARLDPDDFFSTPITLSSFEFRNIVSLSRKSGEVLFQYSSTFFRLSSQPPTIGFRLYKHLTLPCFLLTRKCFTSLNNERMLAVLPLGTVDEVAALIVLMRLVGE